MGGVLSGVVSSVLQNLNTASGEANASLVDLETAANGAYQTYGDAYEAKRTADEKAAAAQKKYQEAMNLYAFGSQSAEDLDRMMEAKRALDDAQAEAQEADEAFEKAAAKAQAAADAVERKKDELRESRSTDTTYVVHSARVECPYGMRESYLALETTHGVLTRQMPQMTAKDTVLDTNIINFGGCYSLENPSVKKAAEDAARAANEQIHSKDNWGFRDWVVGLFVKEKDIEVTESLMEQCVGECIAQFPADAEWEEGHEKVFVNGEPVLMRKCSLMCNYGGLITILLSGQPE